MISVCCVGLASFYVLEMNLMIVPGILVFSSFRISVYTFIGSTVLLISSATVIVPTWGAI